jgi:predicted permease
VAVINERMAHRLWPGENPIGKRFTRDDSEPQPAEVVGVIADIHHYGLDEEVGPEFYIPVEQVPSMFWEWTGGSMHVVIKTEGDPMASLPALRAQVAAIDRDLPVYNATTLKELVAESVTPTRLLMVLLGIFAALALVLATIGIYGVMAFIVGQRSAEFGIRMALGAEATQVRRMVLRQGLGLAGLGVGFGVLAALGLSRFLRGSLFEVPPTDPVTFVAVAMLLTVTTIAAGYLPARRATRVDPIRALRSD